MKNLSRYVPILLAMFLLAALAKPAFAQPVVMSDDTKKATAKALAWLASKQNQDGSFSDGGYAHNTAITGFALMAFLSQGHLPNQGLYGPEVAKGTRFLMASSREQDGYLVGARGGDMYAHGMATLALAQIWGQTGDDEIRAPLKRAVDLIVRCQNPQGGWRYKPTPHDADISVTIMQVMALRAAKNAGMHVPDETLQKAIKYIKSCYVPAKGGFTYQPNSGQTGFARTAAGMCVLFLSGAYTAQEIPAAVKYLKEHFNSPQHFFYGHYYAAHAMYQVGGKDWEDWYQRLEQYFLKQQHPDGSWARLRHREVGPVYQTSIAVIVLSVPAHYLPIFQR